MCRPLLHCCQLPCPLFQGVELMQAPNETLTVVMKVVLPLPLQSRPQNEECPEDLEVHAPLAMLPAPLLPAQELPQALWKRTFIAARMHAHPSLGLTPGT